MDGGHDGWDREDLGRLVDSLQEKAGGEHPAPGMHHTGSARGGRPFCNEGDEDPDSQHRTPVLVHRPQPPALRQALCLPALGRRPGTGQRPGDVPSPTAGCRPRPELPAAKKADDTRNTSWGISGQLGSDRRRGEMPGRLALRALWLSARPGDRPRAHRPSPGRQPGQLCAGEPGGPVPAMSPPHPGQMAARATGDGLRPTGVDAPAQVGHTSSRGVRLCWMCGFGRM